MTLNTKQIESILADVRGQLIPARNWLEVLESTERYYRNEMLAINPGWEDAVLPIMTGVHLKSSAERSLRLIAMLEAQDPTMSKLTPDDRRRVRVAAGRLGWERSQAKKKQALNAVKNP